MTSCSEWVKLVCQMKNRLKSPLMKRRWRKRSWRFRQRREKLRHPLGSARDVGRYVYKLSVKLPSDEVVMARTDETNTWRVTGDKDGSIVEMLASRAESYIRTYGLPAQPTTDASQFADAIVLTLPGSRILSGPTQRLRKNTKY